MPLLGEQDDLLKIWNTHRISLKLDELPIRAIIVVSAHFHSSAPAVCSAARPKMIFDYSGFPEESYQYSYSAPGDPTLASEICRRIQSHGFPCTLREDWGFDHGVFVPLLKIFPKAHIPVINLSICPSEGTEPMNLGVGEAIASLRKEGVLILGSGASSHNFRYFFTPRLNQDPKFDLHLNEVLCSPKITQEQRKTELLKWRSWPSSEQYHPQNGADHFFPLLTLAAASNYLPAKGIRYGDRILQSHFEWQ